MIEKYESLASDLLEWIEQTIIILNNRKFANSLNGVQQQLQAFNTYRTVEKPPKWVTPASTQSQMIPYTPMQPLCTYGDPTRWAIFSFKTILRIFVNVYNIYSRYNIVQLPCHSLTPFLVTVPVTFPEHHKFFVPNFWTNVFMKNSCHYLKQKMSSPNVNEWHNILGARLSPACSGISFKILVLLCPWIEAIRYACLVCNDAEIRRDCCIPKTLWNKCDPANLEVIWCV